MPLLFIGFSRFLPVVKWLPGIGVALSEPVMFAAGPDLAKFNFNS